MLHTESGKQLNSLRNEVSIELKELVIEETIEISRNFISFLKTRSKSICQGGDVWNVSILAYFRFFLYTSLELCIPICK